ncbi:hypothetical protein BGZ65_002264, partial [Modicella reniformis]
MTLTIVQTNAIADAVAITDAKPTAVPDSAMNKNKAGSTTPGSYRHTFPVHTKIVPSPLSKEAPPESYRGFVNLGMLLLFGNNIRLIIENYLKYGFLLSFPGSNVSRQDWILTAITHAILPFNLIAAYKLEAWAKKQADGFKKRRADEVSKAPSSSSTAPDAVAPGDDVQDAKDKKKYEKGKGEAKIQSVDALAKANQST